MIEVGQMREVIFRRQNKGKWEEFETLFKNRKSASGDQLADVYVEIMNDLSYASTYYPNSKTHSYLNNFATELHRVIYKNRKVKRGKFISFWKYEVPLIVKEYHPFFLISVAVFVLFLLIGAVTQHIYPEFARVILGDSYVEMTLDNIEKGDPMAVYKDEGKFFMFYRIFLNNLFVGLKTVAFGVVPILGTLYILLQNGVMIGSFLYFFVQHNVVWEAFTTVFIHGTIELTTIMVEGAAGFIISKSILFPGTYTRLASFMRGVKDAIKISVGVIPFTLIAAFFEGYVTRYTSMPEWLSVLIISLSFLLMIYYYIIYPIQLDAKLERDISNPVLEIKDL